MASAQSEKPYEQSKLQQIENSTYHRRSSTNEIRHNKNNSTNTHEHALSDKVKGMANSARKLFNHHDNPHAPDHTRKPSANCSNGAKTKTEATKKKNNKIEKNTQGHEGNCMPKMLDHVKNLKKNNNNNKKEKKYSDSDSD